VGGLLGTAGGVNGTGIQGPSQATILNPTTTAQAQQQYGNAQNALAQQQGFVNAVNQANGVGNQSQVFNALSGVANGTGPNPAQAQLAQATGQNVANQAALMAGQRGSGANVGLMARQAAQQGAATQQQAAGQAATLQSQQQLNALNAQGNIATNQANQQANAVQGLNSATQGEQGQILGGIASQNNANVAMQSNVNEANAGLAGKTMQGQSALLGGAINGISSVASMGAAGSGAAAAAAAKGGMVPNMTPQYATGGSVYENIAPGTTPFDQQQSAPTAPAAQMPPPGGHTPLVNSAPAANAAQKPKSVVAEFLSGASKNPQQNGYYSAGQGIGKAIGSGMNSLFGSSNPAPAAPNTPSSVDSSDAQAAMMGAPGTRTAQGMPTDQATYDLYRSLPDAPQMAKGGKVPALVSPGEQYLPPKEAKEVAKGKKDPLKTGERIPGKPKFPGNDYRNDIVPKTLESGGIVIPNEVMQSKHPHWAAMKFVQATMAKNGKLPPKPGKK
jgi:hypothetical protein